MIKQIKVSAPGKLHLLGEHAIVYGKPAILAAMNKRCVISLTPREDHKIEIISKNFTVSETFNEKKISEKTKDAQEKWEKFSQTNDPALLKLITANILDYPAIVIGETLKRYGVKLPSGFTIEIDSEIPVGSGMGSSAALAVSIAGVVTLFLDKPFDKEIINQIAFLSEQKKHGFPSGGDNSTCCYGGLVWFRRETPDFKIIQPVPFTLSESVAKNFLTIFTGTPNESTGELVSDVRALYTAKQKKIGALFDHQEQLTRDLLSALQQENHKEIINYIRSGEKNLEAIGVVSSSVQSLIRKIEKAGGAAKICGAGGATKGAGIVLIYHTDKKVITELLEKENIDFSEVSLGCEGLRYE